MKYAAQTLRITELFHSLQGESIRVGLPTVFVRLTGCPLRCNYCDTAYAFNGGTIVNLATLVEQISAFHCPYICITGGEPLAQPNCINFIQFLCEENYHVSLETSGAMDISEVDPRTMIVMDLKTPGSGECEKNQLSNLQYLKISDQIKFVLCDRKDYDWAVSLVKEYNLTAQTQVLFSPSWQELNPTTLANWILEDKLPVRFQLQLHKILWDDARGH